MGLRDQIRALKKLAGRRGVGQPEPLPLTVVCRRREGEEKREPGVYWDAPRRGPEIVFTPGDDQDEQINLYLNEIAKALDADESWSPLVIVEGPEHVPPPADLPRE